MRDSAWGDTEDLTVVVTGAEVLRGDAGGSHAQEIEAGIKETEDRRADGDGAQVHGIVEMPGDARVHHAEQWHGDI